MGLDFQGTRFLLYAKNTGVDLSTTATIGRQWLNLSASVLHKCLADFGYVVPIAEVNRMVNHRFTELFLEFLGAQEIRSLDKSDYELATDIVDLNLPIPSHLRNRFSCVIDAGTLEHVFNFPQAIKSCMEMVRVDGSFACVTVANNFNGHGFYQFSPELFYRIFRKENGFRIEKMIVTETRSTSRWYEVIDPEIAQSRVEFIGPHQTYLMILAQKIRQTDIFTSMPYQSDYVKMWSSETKVDKAGSGSPSVRQIAGGRYSLEARIKKSIPQIIKDMYHIVREDRRYNRRYFREMQIPPKPKN